MAIKVNTTEIPTTLIEAKRWWRGEIKKRLAATTPEYRTASSEAIAEALLTTDEYKSAKTIMLYVSVGREVETKSLIDKAAADGKNVCLPLCLDMDAEGKRLGSEHIMEARAYTCEKDLVPGAYGIPTPDGTTVLVRPEEIDLVVLPCVTCDVECNRLGHGAGYYDRYLKQLRAGCAQIALCYEEVIGEKIPMEEHDRPVDAVISEERIYRRK